MSLDLFALVEIVDPVGDALNQVIQNLPRLFWWPRQKLSRGRRPRFPHLIHLRDVGKGGACPQSRRKPGNNGVVREGLTCAWAGWNTATDLVEIDLRCPHRKLLGELDSQRFLWTD